MVFGKRCQARVRIFLLLVVGAVMPLRAASDPPLEAAVGVTADWGWGFRARIDLQNPSAKPVKEWILEIETRSLIRNVYGARMVRQGNGRVVLAPMAGGGLIPPGGSVVIHIGGVPGISSLRALAKPHDETGSSDSSSGAGSVEVLVNSKPGSTVATLRNRTWRRLRNWEVEFDLLAEPVGGMESRPSKPGTQRISAPGPLSEIGLAPMQSVSISLQARQPGPHRLPSARAVHALIAPTFPATPSYYARALRLSLLFYEAQRSGRLPPNRRVRWRGDSALADGADVGLDLTGGYYDAGDHVKFVFPMAAAMTVLAWGGVEYEEGFRQAGEWDNFLSTLRWGTDWLLKAHPAPNIFVGQIGEPLLEHAQWAPPEKMLNHRRTFLLTPQNPGTEVAAEASAALAAASVVFRKADPAYAQRLRQNARSLFDFADRHRGSYSQSISDAERHYPSRNGYLDELAWAAAWNFAATGDKDFLKRARTLYAEAVNTSLAGVAFSWDDKRPGLAVLMARIDPGPRFINDARTFLLSWAAGSDGITVTPGGLAWINGWGSLRYAAHAAFLGFVFNDRINSDPGFLTFARNQIDYILGGNPAGRSYVVGFGRNPPRSPHHRAAHGSTTGSIDDPPNNTFVLYGALIGGPPYPDDFSFRDDRRDASTNEVALDYNAAFTGALARMAAEEAGIPRRLDFVRGNRQTDRSSSLSHSQ
jgi:endoglucanase